MALLYLLIVLAALAGFSLSFYLWLKKRQRKVFVCPIGTNCHDVIHSEYSRFLGLPVERLGLLYYLAVLVVYGLLLAVIHQQLINLLSLAALTLSFSAFLFSVYLTFAQLFSLRHWCSWCLTSAALSTVIFFAGLAGLDRGFVALLATFRPALAMGTLLAAAAGAGTASVVGMLMFRFLRDLRISQFEADIIRVVSDLVWVSLGSFLLVVLELFLIGPEPMISFGYFGTIVVCALLLAVASLLLYLLVLPRVVKISFGEAHEHHAGELKLLRRAVLLLGWGSLGLWYLVISLLAGTFVLQY